MGVFGDVATGLVGIWAIDKITGKRKKVYVRRKNAKAKANKKRKNNLHKRRRSAFDSVFHA